MGSDIIIIECDDTHAYEWNQFLSRQPTASMYQLYEWKNINNQHFGHVCNYLAALKNDKIVGVFPLVYINSQLFGKIYCSMPFVNFGGPCATDNNVEQQLLDAAIDRTRQANADYLEIRSTRLLQNSLPTSTHKVSMTIELSPDPENLWNAFASKHRTNIRRAYKNDLSVKAGGNEFLDTFYNILAQSWRAMGTPIYKRSYFENIIGQFGERIRIFICYQGNRPIAAAFNGYYNDTVEGMWAGAIPGARRLQYSYVLYWEMIKHACETGYRHYHLGRSSVDSGGEQFKKKWNAQQLQLYWHYYLHNLSTMPALNVDNPKYALAIKIWRKLPLNLTMAIGPLLARSIP